jgi:hypothetical protein
LRDRALRPRWRSYQRRELSGYLTSADPKPRFQPQKQPFGLAVGTWQFRA